MKRTADLICLVLLVLALPIAWFAIRAQGMTHLNWALPVSLLIWLVLFGVWYLCFGPANFRRRLAHVGAAGLSMAVMGGLGALLLHYEGSASGSSFPKVRWAWESPEDSPGTVDELVQGDLSASAADLTQRAAPSTDFLGADRDGMAPDLIFGTDWSASPPELLWRRPIGKAWSSFTVQEGRAVTQEQSGPSERVLCLDLVTGEEIWHHENEGVRLLDVKKENAGARMGGDGPRATPVISGDRVFAYGSTGILDCLDLSTGEPIWEKDVLATHGSEVQKWGMASSPLLLEPEGLVVVTGSDQPGATLIALERETGEEAWVYRGDGASYSSPRILSPLGVRQVVSVNAHSVTGHNPATGERLWKEEWRGSFPKVGQPILVGEDRILVTASYGAGSLLLRLRDSGGEWSVDRLWKSNRLKTKFSTAAVLGDLAYGLDEGRLAAIDLETGDKVWKKEKFGFGQHLLFGEHLLVQAEKGPVVLGTISPEGFTEVARLDALSSMTWNVPTVAGRILLVRNDQEAAAYLLPPPSPPE